MAGRRGIAAGRGAADRIIIGRAATLGAPDDLGWAGALAIRGGRVAAVGSVADVGSLAGPATVTWRLPPDAVVMPSITDAHLHLTAAALAASQPDVTGLDVAAVVAVVTAEHERLVRGGDHDSWLLGHGWSFDALGTRPSAAILEAAAPGRPVALWAHDHHARWLNREAIRRARIGRRADPAAGRIERDVEGEPTGILYEGAAGLVDELIPEPRAGEVEAALSTYAKRLARLGVTSVHDPGGLAPDPQLRGGPLVLRAMARAGSLALRVTASIREEQLERALALGFRSGRPGAADGSGRYRDGWLKLFADGALGSRTAALLLPYEPGDPAGAPPGSIRGMPLRSQAQLADVATRAAEAGIASQIHAIGDAAVRNALDVIERLPAVPGFCHRIEHAQLIHPSDVPRFGALGIAASVQPCHLISDAAAMHAAWGSRIATAFPLAALVGSGALLPFGTDAPVESPDPWPGIAAAVSRRGPGWASTEAVRPEQSITLGRALRAACLDGPRSAGVGDQGHLDVGASADLLVVPANALGQPTDPDRLATIRPLATLLDGDVVYLDPAFDP